jgi:hypothetical protein
MKKLEYKTTNFFFYRIKNLLIIFFLNPNFFHDKICYIYLKIQ